MRRWVKLGDWSGKAETFSVPLNEIPKGDYSLKDIDRLDVVVQSGVATKPGLMLGTATDGLLRRSRQTEHSDRSASKKIGPALSRPEGIRGLNRTRNSTGPADRAPGGWGAEESGARTGPGLEATVRYPNAA